MLEPGTAQRVQWLWVEFCQEVEDGSMSEPGTGSEPHVWSGLGWMCSQSLRSKAEAGFWIWGAVGARLQGQRVRGW